MLSVPSSEKPLAVLGRTRCYWTILDSSLNFIFLDPVLETHLGEEVNKFLGTNLLDWVHPDEIDSLKTDLMPSMEKGGLAGVQKAGVFGSVTTCRYARVALIRAQLGATIPVVDDSNYKWVLDYLELRITTSWIGTGDDNGKGGAVLVFFHGIEDKDARADNDPTNILGGWSNWCGAIDGPYLTPTRCEELRRALSAQSTPFPTSPSGATNSLAASLSLLQQFERKREGPPHHVFQILDSTGEAILSFPDPCDQDGFKYEASEYSKLARQVVAKPRTKSDAFTSCTRRYRSKHPIIQGGALFFIESVVILYGTITFACFQTCGVSLGASSKQRSVSIDPQTFKLEEVPEGMDLRQQQGADAALPAKLAYDEPIPVIHRPENHHQPPRATPPVSHFPQSSSGINRRHDPLSIAPQHYTPRVESNNTAALSPTVANASEILGSFSNPYYPPPGPSSHLHPPHHPQPSNTSSRFNQSQFAHYPPPIMKHSPPFNNNNNNHYPSHPLAQSSHNNGQYRPPPYIPLVSAPELEKKPPVQKKGTGKACAMCGVLNSPEWRKGPDGTKSVCNACGLRYARSLKKKDVAGSSKQSSTAGSQSPASGGPSRVPTPKRRDNSAPPTSVAIPRSSSTQLSSSSAGPSPSLAGVRTIHGDNRPRPYPNRASSDSVLPFSQPQFQPPQYPLHIPSQHQYQQHLAPHQVQQQSSQQPLQNHPFNFSSNHFDHPHSQHPSSHLPPSLPPAHPSQPYDSFQQRPWNPIPTNSTTNSNSFQPLPSYDSAGAPQHLPLDPYNQSNFNPNYRHEN